MNKDLKGNTYIEVENLRLTFVPAIRRAHNENWSNSDVIRIQAYKGKGSALHMGAEIPIRDSAMLLELISGLIQLYRHES